MARAWTLSAKLGAIGSVLLVLALASIGLTLSVTWKLEGGAAAVNEAGRMRMQTWRMAQTLGAGDAPLLVQQMQQFEQSLALLERGDPARPLAVPHAAATRSTFAQVRERWATLGPRWRTAPSAPAQAAQEAEGFVRHIDHFVDAIEGELARWTSVLHLFQLTMMGLAIASAVTLLYSAYLLVFAPLARLQEALARVESGDLGARVQVDRRDEFGALGAGFNRMAATLQGLYQNLEAKVAEKTERLRAERERLSALYEASAFVARADSLPALAQGFAAQMRRVARADAAAVRWSDEANRRFVLVGHDALPQAMLEHERCLHRDECLCGRVAPQGSASRVIPIQAGDGRLGHCSAEGFERVLTVPVRLHERTLGEVDLLYRGSGAPGAEDRALLETMASHLAGALESQRAAALEREAAVAEERGLLARELHDSIAQGLAFLKIQVQLLRQAFERGERPQVQRALAELDEGVRESTADVRELLLHFRTRTNGEDILPALQSTLSKFQHQSGVTAQLEVQGEGVPLPPDTQVQVLHVVQEALSNIRKHAQARAVHVTLRQDADFCVQVRDDGRGFHADPEGAGETQVGLRIMRERAARIGATVEVRSEPGRGTLVELRLPAQPAGDASQAPARQAA
jgi:two-component system, NarL family, nitrate/nitrite sensor histidine kinase NarX